MTAPALDAALRACDVDVAAVMTSLGCVAGQPVPYTVLADTFEEIAETSKRLSILTRLTTCFRVLLLATPEDLLPAIYMCVNRVAPSHQGVELGMGESTLIKALAESTGRKEAVIKKEYEVAGDLGVVAVNARSTQRTMFAMKPLTIRGVFQVFKDIASACGQSSQDRKRSMVVKLLAASKGNEAGYIIRSLQAKLRIGLAEQSVLTALAHAVLLHREGTGLGKKDGGVGLADRLERSAQAVKAAYSECPSYDEVVPALLSYGPWELSQHCHFKPSVPVKPMLAKPTTGVGEVLEKFKDQEFTCEYKYDGERAQVHIMEGGAKIMIFSRNSENMTAKYPDIVSRLPGLLLPGVDSLVLDGEAVGWDPLAGKILPFQILSTRARKDVALADIKVQVVLYAFDCLYVNGRSLLQAPLTERRAALYASVKEKPSELQFALTKTSRDLEELELFLTEAVEAATEGLIVKTMDDTYEPARRSSHWLKLKKDYMEGVGDTFDVVPIGAFYGKGKRTGLYGAYLLAVYDPDNERYQTISKLGTGFSEEQLQELADSLRPHLIPEPRKYYQWGEAQQPDVWFEPVKVWEVKAADLSISPVHKAAHGLVDAGKGISIRFPRLIRIRDDKGPEDATSAEQVADMYRNQAVVMAAKRGKAVADGDGDD
ncbi:ATP-dependent DNA ligase [Haematococcus lacustris]